MSSYRAYSPHRREHCLARVDLGHGRQRWCRGYPEGRGYCASHRRNDGVAFDAQQACAVLVAWFRTLNEINVRGGRP